MSFAVAPAWLAADSTADALQGRSLNCSYLHFGLPHTIPSAHSFANSLAASSTIGEGLGITRITQATVPEAWLSISSEIAAASAVSIEPDRQRVGAAISTASSEPSRRGSACKAAAGHLFPRHCREHRTGAESGCCRPPGQPAGPERPQLSLCKQGPGPHVAAATRPAAAGRWQRRLLGTAQPNCRARFGGAGPGG